MPMPVDIDLHLALPRSLWQFSDRDLPIYLARAVQDTRRKPL